MTDLEKYLEKTGQDLVDLMGGASQVGMEYVTDELVPHALAENKIITWVPEDEELGTGTYELTDVPELQDA